MNLCFLRPTESTTQTANQSVQLLLHSSRQSVIRTRWLHVANTIQFMLPLAHLSPQLKWHLDWFSRFCTVHSRKSLYFTVGCPFPSKLPLLMGDLDLHLIHGSLGPPESSNQTASWSIQLILQGSLVWQTDRLIDRTCYSVNNNRQTACTYMVLRCGLIINNNNNMQHLTHHLLVVKRWIAGVKCIVCSNVYMRHWLHLALKWFVCQSRSLMCCLIEYMASNPNWPGFLHQPVMNNDNKASIRWQDSARRQFQAGLRGDVGL